MHFGFIRSDFGVDTSRSLATMIVPVKGHNLVLLFDGAGSTVKIASGSGNIKLKEITKRNDLEREIANVR